MKGYHLTAYIIEMLFFVTTLIRRRIENYLEVYRTCIQTTAGSAKAAWSTGISLRNDYLTSE